MRSGLRTTAGSRMSTLACIRAAQQFDWEANPVTDEMHDFVFTTEEGRFRVSLPRDLWPFPRGRWQTREEGLAA